VLVFRESTRHAAPAGAAFSRARGKFPGKTRGGNPAPIRALVLRSRSPELATMLDRQQLEALLAKRFPGSTQEQIAAAANAIMAMTRGAGNPADDDSPLQNTRARWTASGLPLPRT
jgi:hypothetical protein